MRYAKDYTDERHGDHCVVCGVPLTLGKSSKDHVPPKSVLNKPYPNRLPTVPACTKCNNESGAKDEYFAAWLGATMSMTVDPDHQVLPKTATILRSNQELMQRLNREFTRAHNKEGKFLFLRHAPESRNEITDTILKVGRGLVLFELGEFRPDPPIFHFVQFAGNMSHEDRREFDASVEISVLPEIGARAMSRMLIDGNNNSYSSWVNVQDGVFRYMAFVYDGLVIKMIFHEYLLVQFIWPSGIPYDWNDESLSANEGMQMDFFAR